MLGRQRIAYGRVLDAGLAALLVAVGQADAWLGWDDGDNGLAVHHDRALSALLLALTRAPVAWRRSRPLPALAVSLSGAVLAGGLVGQAPFVAGLVPVLFLVYATAAYGRSDGEQWLGLALAALGAVLTCELVPTLRTFSTVTFNLAVIAALWLVGRLVHARGRRVDVLERSRETALAEERKRIARELHDIVAHSVSTMVIQAGAAEQLIADDPAGARGALMTIRRTGRDALHELRRLLDLLREHDDAEIAPPPTLAGIEQLITGVRDAGLSVELDASSAQHGIPAGVGLTAYRVVQESLVNALKHAPGAHVVVQLRLAAHALEILVSDDGGTGDPGGAPHDAGHGLVGMRERVQLYGGRLDAYPVDVGFRVNASIPVEAPA
jgi:signal transduction histidine kinase